MLLSIVQQNSITKMYNCWTGENFYELTFHGQGHYNSHNHNISFIQSSNILYLKLWKVQMHMYDKPICTGLTITNTPFTQAQPIAKPQGNSNFPMLEWVSTYANAHLTDCVLWWCMCWRQPSTHRDNLEAANCVVRQNDLLVLPHHKVTVSLWFLIYFGPVLETLVLQEREGGEKQECIK